MEKIDFKEKLVNFLDNEGKLKNYPSKYKNKIYALFYLASKFEHGVKYSEMEVNDILNKWHNFGDWAMLRRDLYDKKIFNRTVDSKTYWLETEPPSLEKL